MEKSISHPFPKPFSRMAVIPPQAGIHHGALEAASTKLDSSLRQNGHGIVGIISVKIYPLPAFHKKIGMRFCTPPRSIYVFGNQLY
jgi:hypothetical protein